MQRIRRILAPVLVLAWAVATIGVAFAQAENVYVTKTGAKYHRASCSSLSKSKIEMPLAVAAASYGACKNCRPPVPGPTPARAAAFAQPKSQPNERARPATAARCQGTTKKGTQCSRKAQAGRSYCWQH
jgi:hypothetical protein